MSQDSKDTLIKGEGALEFLFGLFSPPFPNEELPDPPYILIRYFEAKPPGRHLLKRYAAEMITQIRARLKSSRTVIFQPANGEIGNEQAQERLERYYRSCGFDYLPSSKSRWWMTWPEDE